MTLTKRGCTCADCQEEGGCDECVECLVAMVYTPEGARLWLDHTERQGWSDADRVACLLALAQGPLS